MTKNGFERPRIIFLNHEILGWPLCSSGSGAEAGAACSAGDNNRHSCQTGTSGDGASSCGQGNGYGMTTCQTGDSVDCCLTGSDGARTGTCQRGNTDSACTTTGTGYGAPDDCSNGGTYAGLCSNGGLATSCLPVGSSP